MDNYSNSYISDTNSITRFFYMQPFSKQRRAEIGKKSSKS